VPRPTTGTDAPQRVSYSISIRYVSAPLLILASHTAGCKYVQIFATPGWRILSKWYSRQYQ